MRRSIKGCRTYRYVAISHHAAHTSSFVLLVDRTFSSKVGNLDFLLMYSAFFVAIVGQIPLQE